MAQVTDAPKESLDAPPAGEITREQAIQIAKEERKKEQRKARRAQKQQQKARKKKEKMTEMKRATPKTVDGRRLRSDPLLNISPEGYNSIGQLGLSSSENAAIFGVNFFQEGSTAAAPRETFKCLCTDCLDNSKLCVSDFRCAAMTYKEGKHETTVYSCLNYSQPLMELAYCEGGREGKSSSYTVRTICCSGEMCNNVPPPKLPSTPASAVHTTTSSIPYIHPAVFLVLPALLCLLLILLILLIIYKRMKSKQKRRKEKERIRNYLVDDLSAQPLTADCSIELPDPTSGSGSGMPKLVKRTVAKSVTLLDQIGRGRYGNVYKAIYQGSPVAVKIFLSKDESSWSWENEIYTTLLLRHENILGFMASDVISCDAVTQFWLICHYHKHGSLYDFLNQPYNCITASQCLLMLYSAASGLVHLHTEIFGTQAKSAIAHRDIKSKNILVKEDGSCCIADLGLSVMHKPVEGVLWPVNRNKKVGTKRYMAPEVLSECMSHEDFEAYKRADIYSFSLVMWETAQCTLIDGTAEKYHMPYGGLVPNDPTYEQMKHVVVTQKKRPQIPFHWRNHKIFYLLSKLMQECWSPTPSARLTILRVKKSLSYLLEEARDYKEHV